MKQGLIKRVTGVFTQQNSMRVKKSYRHYVLIFLLLLPLYATAKTLLDIHILINTGRIVGTEDWIILAFSKREKLAEDIPVGQPRILIVSGSNGLFGLSAQAITQATEIKSINLSSHAGLGGDYILKRAQKIIRKNDIILLPLEYQFYSQLGIAKDFDRRDTLRRFLISYDRSYLQKVPFAALLKFYLNNVIAWQNKEYMYYLSGHLTREDIIKRLQQQRDKTDFNCFSGLTFNDYGDETCNIGKENLPIDPAVIKTAMAPSNKRLDPGGYIHEFIQFSQNHHVKLVPLYPVSTRTQDYSTPAFQQYAQNIKQFWQSQGIIFDDSLESSLLPSNLMYNTYYHPRDSGRQVRTKAVIQLLQHYFKQNYLKSKSPNI